MSGEMVKRQKYIDYADYIYGKLMRRHDYDEWSQSIDRLIEVILKENNLSERGGEGK